jgi:hypothetical protein
MIDHEQYLEKYKCIRENIRDSKIKTAKYNPCIDNYKKNINVHGPLQGGIFL